MINLVTKSDFLKTYQIFAGSAEHESYLADVIARYQPQILRQILGEIEYQNMVADYVAGAWTSLKWNYFVNGTNYTVSGVTYHYEGIKQVLIRLIYYYWHVEAASILGESGELKGDYAKIRQVIPAGKMASVYNEGVDMIQNTDDYYPSVYHYLDNAYTFSDWEFKTFTKINPYV